MKKAIWLSVNGFDFEAVLLGLETVGRPCQCTKLLMTLNESKSLAGGGHVPITCCLSELSWNRPAPITESFFS